MTRLDSQIQLELTINPARSFVVPFEVFEVAQVRKEQPIASVALFVRQPYQPIGNHAVFRVLESTGAQAEAAVARSYTHVCSSTSVWTLPGAWLRSSRRRYVHRSRNRLVPCARPGAGNQARRKFATATSYCSHEPAEHLARFSPARNIKMPNSLLSHINSHLG